MTVAQLIAELQKQDPDAEAMVWNGAAEDYMSADEVEPFEYPPFPFKAAVRVSG